MENCLRRRNNQIANKYHRRFFIAKTIDIDTFKGEAISVQPLIEAVQAKKQQRIIIAQINNKVFWGEMYLCLFNKVWQCPTPQQEMTRFAVDHALKSPPAIFVFCPF